MGILRKSGYPVSAESPDTQGPDTRNQDTQNPDTATSTDWNEAVPEHIIPLSERLPADLIEDERRKAITFIKDHVNVFAKSEFDLGQTSIAEHRINTGNNKPFKQTLRRHPIAHLPLIDEHVDKMLAGDIVEKSDGPWSSNIVLVKKKDSSLRFCVDYRQLNSLTVHDSFTTY